MDTEKIQPATPPKRSPETRKIHRPRHRLSTPEFEDQRLRKIRAHDHNGRYLEQRRTTDNHNRWTSDSTTGQPAIREQRHAQQADRHQQQTNFEQRRGE